MAGRRYRFYIDESGDHTYNLLDDTGRRYLGLCGCIFELSHVNGVLIPEMDTMKRRHFHPHDPDEPVILHRNDIINRRGPFRVLRDEIVRKAFDDDLIGFLARVQYKIIAVVIDKLEHKRKYGSFAWHPYHYCLTALLDRYCGLLNHLGDTGDVMAESRGGAEDKQLKTAYQHLYQHGSYHRPPAFYQRALTSNAIKLKKKSANIAGLQVADLLAHPCKQEILWDRGKVTVDDLGSFCRRITQILQTKYNRHLYSGRVDGYGKVFLG